MQRRRAARKVMKWASAAAFVLMLAVWVGSGLLDCWWLGPRGGLNVGRGSITIGNMGSLYAFQPGLTVFVPGGFKLRWGIDWDLNAGATIK